jgi:iron complex outermembrane receptor protein
LLKSNLYEDIDGLSRGIVPLTGQSVALLETNNILDFSQFTEELQVQGPAKNGLIDWIGGLFYSHYEGTDAADFAQIGSRAFNIYKVEAQSFGLYGQMDVKLSDKLTLTGGYRYTWDDRSAVYQNLSNPRGVNAGINLSDTSIGFFGEYGDDIRLPNPLNPAACNFNRQATGTRPALAGVNLTDCTARRSLNTDAPTYNITVQYKPTDDVLVYLAHRQGYRAGSLAGRATTDEGVVNQNEQVRDLELGLKSQFYIGDMPSRFNAATYYSWYTNIAVAVTRLDPVTLLALNQAENSGQAHLYGGEASFDIRPVEGLSLSATYGYTVGIYDAFPSQTVNDALNNPIILYSNADLEFGHPRHSWTLGGTYELPLSETLGEVSVSLNYAHFSERPDQKGFFTLPEYGVANARVDWKNIAGRPVDLAVYVNNLSDEDYLDAVFSNEDSVGFRAGFPADPRTYGVNLTYRFGG